MTHFAQHQTRRAVLASITGGLTLALAPTPTRAAPTWRDGDPFKLGVASGCPRPDGFVLWTRLAPNPFSSDPAAPGGVAGGDIAVRYAIASDENMRHIVRSGVARASSAFAHSVHERITGLQPNRPYWYRFTCGEAQSGIGRAITLPAEGAPTDRLKFGFVSCSNYEHGYFSAYGHLADEHPDLVAYLGDYIYEYVESRRPKVRTHSDNVEAHDLRTYRNRYAQYHLDENLQRIHAVAPALITWDDHEVQNDYADRWSQTFDDPERFLQRRTAAYQAFYEHMPVDPVLSAPNGNAMRVYDKFAYGDLAQFYMIDGRQYRSREACYAQPDKGGGHVVTNAACPERLAAERSMIGQAQEAWLFDNFDRSHARWNVIAQDVPMAQLREMQPDGQAGFWTDDWNGYPAGRTRLLSRVRDSHLANPVVITGDSHAFWANNLKADFDDANAPVVATEFVGSSISAPGPDYALFSSWLHDNPHVKYFESRRRGYVVSEITRERMESKFQVISDVADPYAALSTLRTFVVENGRPGAQSA
jgi:alkaline phosphatase D